MEEGTHPLNLFEQSVGRLALAHADGLLAEAFGAGKVARGKLRACNVEAAGLLVVHVDRVKGGEGEAEG